MLLSATGGPPPLDTSTVNTRESRGREGRRSSRELGGGAAAFSWLRVALNAELTMEAHEEGEKNDAREERRPSARRCEPPPPPPPLSIATLLSGAGGYEMPAVPAVSTMGGAPHCTSRKSTDAAPAAATGPPARVSHASVAYDSVNLGGGCAAMSAGGSVTCRNGATPPASGSGALALQNGSGEPRLMVKFPARVADTLPTGTRTTVRLTAGAQLGRSLDVAAGSEEVDTVAAAPAGAAPSAANATAERSSLDAPAAAPADAALPEPRSASADAAPAALRTPLEVFLTSPAATSITEAASAAPSGAAPPALTASTPAATSDESTERPASATGPAAAPPATAASA
jgi:hypothetical protein